ncbi:AVAST type 3 anti-phage proein Avs3b [Marinomonas rhizomae]|nr:AVAST type 3 anti-phage proein Avs3b [Marinomonas rhizomae]
MASAISPPIPDSSLSEPTVELLRCEAVLELGKKLTQELDLDKSVDTLGRWMAHYIAELMQEAEQAVEEERIEKRRVCAEAILSLWKHRAGLAEHSTPLSEFRPLLEFLHDLNPKSTRPCYSDPSEKITEEYQLDESQTQSLQLIESIDTTAKILIRHALMCASTSAAIGSKEWLNLIENAGLEDDPETFLAKLMYGEADTHFGAHSDKKKYQELEKRINQLESFSKVAQCFAADWRKHLANAEAQDAIEE